MKILFQIPLNVANVFQNEYRAQPEARQVIQSSHEISYENGK